VVQQADGRWELRWVLVQPLAKLGDLLDQRGNLFGQGNLAVP
jgi:hypothetical protein